MDNLHQLEFIILLLMAVLALTTVARKLTIPYPILLVIGGLILSFIPGLPTVRLDPDLIFLVFLPPPALGGRLFHLLAGFSRQRSPDHTLGGRLGDGNRGSGGECRPCCTAGPRLGRSHYVGSHCVAP